MLAPFRRLPRGGSSRRVINVSHKAIICAPTVALARWGRTDGRPSTSVGHVAHGQANWLRRGRVGSVRTQSKARTNQSKKEQAMPPRILIAEDEEPLLELLRYNFEKAGYTVEALANGDHAGARLKEVVPDMAVLDWMLPGLSGIELCRRLRQSPATKRLPMIMLSARTDELDRLRGFEVG